MHGIRIDYAASYWTPPMTPKLAFELESRQIEKLDLAPMVSITDHDNINGAHAAAHGSQRAADSGFAGVDAFRLAEQSFHLGVHNLPSAACDRVDEDAGRLHRQTRSDARLTEILQALARRAECAGGLQPPHVGSLPDWRREAQASGQRVSAEERRITCTRWS